MNRDSNESNYLATYLPLKILKHQASLKIRSYSEIRSAETYLSCTSYLLELSTLYYGYVP